MRLAVWILLGFAACTTRSGVPPKFILVPDRAEDLRFLDVHKYGIAYQAGVVTSTEVGVRVEPRRSVQMLPDRERPYLAAVVRVAGQGRTEEAAAAVAKIGEPQFIREVLIDFEGDASAGREMVAEVRRILPGKPVALFRDAIGERRFLASPAPWSAGALAGR
ncbi:MAG: hypothetical protein R2729_08025 [Bryobacteraceae bacterium]